MAAPYIYPSANGACQDTRWLTLTRADDTGWPQNIHPEFQVYPGLYLFIFMIEPLTGQ